MISISSAEKIEEITTSNDASENKGLFVTEFNNEIIICSTST